jgi:hypothetical protein
MSFRDLTICSNQPVFHHNYHTWVIRICVYIYQDTPEDC